MLLGKQGTDHGSRALAQTQAGQYALSLDVHGAFHEDVINGGLDGWSIIERLVRLNYGADVALPQLVVRNMPTVDWMAVLPVLFKGVECGAIKPDFALDVFSRRVTRAPQPDVDTRDEYAASKPTPADPEPTEDDDEENDDDE